MTRKSFVLIAIAILIAIVILVRFAALENREFFNVDEFAFYKGANNAFLLKNLFTNLPTILRNGELFPFYLFGIAKGIFIADSFLPMYCFLSMASAAIAGIRPETAFYMNAIFGILTLVVFFLLCRRFFSVRTALIAVFMMSFSPTHIFYSRFGFSVSIALFFIITSIYFYLRSRETADGVIRNRILSGLFAALAGTTHAAYLLFFPIYGILELYKFCASKNRLRSFFHSIYLFTPFVFLAILLELPYFMVHTYFAVKGKIPFFKDYYSSMVSLNNMGSFVSNFFHCHSVNAGWYQAQPKSPEDIFYFFKYLIASEGVGFIFLIFVSVGFLIYRFLKSRSDKLLIVISWAIIPFIFYNTVHLTRQTRHFACLIPALFIAIGYLFDSMLQSKKNKLLSVIFISLFLLHFVFNSVSKIEKIVRSKLDLSHIATYIEKNNLDDILVDSVVMWMPIEDHVIRNLPGFKINLKTKNSSHVSSAGVKSTRYYDKVVLSAPWVSWADVERLYREGYIRYFITSLCDAEMDFPPPGVFKNVKPLVYVDNPHFVYKPGVYDSKCCMHAKRYLCNSSLKHIALYDLREVFGNNDS